MTEADQKRAKELEDYLNYRLDVARAAGEIPLDKIMGYSKVYFCTDSRKAQRYAATNKARFEAAENAEK